MADNSQDAEPGPFGRALGRAKARLARLRERWPVVDQAVRTAEHVGSVQAMILAGAITYFGYLSFFPVLVIAFSLITYVAFVVPEARDRLEQAVEYVFPGLIGDGEDAIIDITEFADSASTVTLVALVGLAYTGLGWMSATRVGLQAVFDVPEKKRRNFFVGKAVDLLVLAVIAVVLFLSVALSSAVTNVTEGLLLFFEIDRIPGPVTFLLLRALGIALGVAVSTLLFFTLFTLLPARDLPRRAVLKGAFVGALGFEVLKLLAGVLIGLATGNPATAVLGTSLVLLLWINYFSRVIMVGAAWAYTSPEARLVRERMAERLRTREELARRRRLRRERYGRRRRAGLEPLPLSPAQRRVDRLSIAAGALSGATATALVHAVRHRR
ncbi:MAG TPA: YihY/virulence factor BrkB family protein [Nocardioidaceae bacterium]|nr:YihY/virulence factor BrkB family protein [Nocardioidaceae bacterium]